MRPVRPSARATSSSSHWPGAVNRSQWEPQSARPADAAALLELMRCIALSRICYGDHHWKMTEAHVNLAQGYLQFKGFSLQAQQHAEKAKEILLASSSIPSSDSQRRMDILKCSVAVFHTLGRSLTALHKLKDSERNLIKTQELLEELLQNDQDKWVEIKAAAELSFAQLCQCQKRSEDAILCYQKALSYIERSKGETNLECIPVHKKMAGVAQVLGVHATAIQHLVKAHFIALRKSPSSGETAETAHLVAQAADAFKQSEHKGVCLLKVMNSYHAVLLVGMHTSVNAAQWITVDLVPLALFLSFCRLCMTVTSFLKHKNGQYPVFQQWPVPSGPEGMNRTDLAEKYFQESINAFKEAEGLESAKCLGAVDDFCQFLIATGPQQLMLFSFPDTFLIFFWPFFLSQRAPIMLKGSLEAKISLFGYLSLEVAETYWLPGGTELAQGHTHLAYKKLKKCLYLQTLLFGTHNKRTVATQEDIDLSK
ncbi:tetratricopeptide repeat protein 23 [Gopherus flavomarginatus]|uniref:tetratricopeptide repeat protein 23 n=1 Tax=Gopherus flavomarginatus TaxID=286002 RepID=UPI0021CBE68B|nr:tetratricopeptide repeat protein 23 [Gopherus flavomarginatus]